LLIMPDMGISVRQKIRYSKSFKRKIETNLFGGIIMTKIVFPRLREQKGGHLIQGTSIGGPIGSVGRAHCAAAKSRVEGRSESLTKEIGSLGIKVTIIEPGGFRTDFASPSSEFRKSRPEYQSTVGATVSFQADYNRKQPGDPLKASRLFCIWCH
jgi:NAD(P)-dependent dehydrogenase (short-subunit alcohol dehydrogenase family)